MHETMGAEFYQNIRYCSNVDTQKFWKDTDGLNYYFTGCLLENMEKEVQKYND
jgi:hypothetical protein